LRGATLGFALLSPTYGSPVGWPINPAVIGDRQMFPLIDSDPKRLQMNSRNAQQSST
jgi:hypothetical protein